MQDTWQILELQKFLKQQAEDELPDAKSVYLSNPKYRREIDAIIVSIWESVRRSVQDSAVSATLANEDQNVFNNIEEKWHKYTTRTLTFMLSDPERPMGAETTKWYCRGNIQCSVIDYMISFDFFIYFPSTIDINKILFLLKNPAFIGMPPELSYEQRIDGEGELSLKFSKGYGAGGGGLLTYGEHAETHAFDEVRNNVNVIYALNALEADFNRNESFDNLYTALVAAYQCR